MEINRFDIASIKRIASCVAVNRKKLAKAEERLAKAKAEVEDLTSQIENFETPIRTKWGYSSEELIRANFDLEVLNGVKESEVEESSTEDEETEETVEDNVPTVE